MIIHRKWVTALALAGLFTAAPAPAAPAAASGGAGAAAAQAPANLQRPWSEDIIYLVMTDRFHNGDQARDQDTEPKSSTGVHGGDLQGVIGKLDYIQKLGVTAIWLTPVAQNQKGGYHGYWITDFYRVDERLGSMETLKKLVDEAHKRGIKVMLDVVVNHTAPTHPWVEDPTKQDWFHRAGGIVNWNDQENVENGQLAGLPDLAQENPAVARYLIDMSKWWIEQTGVDGFRLDTVRHVPRWFWEQYSREIKAAYPGFFLMGEVWNGDLDYLKTYLKSGFDSLVDFARFYPIEETFARGADPMLLHATVARQAKETPGTVWGTFIDNHDVPRFVTGSAPGGAAKLNLALAYLLTAPGMPILYYGTEVALEGGGDPDNRRDMKFDANPGMFSYTQKLIQFRKTNPAFTAGTYTPVSKNGRVVAYLREHAGKKFLVALNNSAVEQRLDLTGLVEPDEALTDLLADRAAPVQTPSLALAPWTPHVYAIGPKPVSPVAWIGGGIAVAGLLAALVAFLRRRKK